MVFFFLAFSYSLQLKTKFVVDHHAFMLNLVIYGFNMQRASRYDSFQ